MSKQTEALKLALEALEYIEHNYMSLPAPATKAITAIREALKSAQQEPVGEVTNERGEIDWISFVPPAGTSLYTSPPASKPWVGLTDEDVEKIIKANMSLQMNLAGIRADFEAKLKEKNT